MKRAWTDSTKADVNSYLFSLMHLSGKYRIIYPVNYSHVNNMGFTL